MTGYENAAPGHPEHPERPAAVPTDLAAAIATGGSSSVADGEWHRMHPLTPLLKGGLVLLIVAGIVLSNFRDRLVYWFVSLVTPDTADIDDWVRRGGDPIEWITANNLVLLALGAVLVILVVLIALFWVMWRMHTYRIDQEHVEVRKGILFRSHRRAPLDRVQGVNLTRPFPARLIGMAKLEVVGAGTDSNVALEYLSTGLAEQVRADILRLASGARDAKRIARGEIPADAPAPAAGRVGALAQTVASGVSDIVEGVDLADVAPESVVKIPAGRLVASQLLNVLPWFVIGMLAVGVATVLTTLNADPEDRLVATMVVLVGLGGTVLFVFAAITWTYISRSLRYSIAPTPDGIRMTFGLLTTVTETLPPGRVHALEVTQPLLWRPFGWWTVKINRLTGASITAQQSNTQQMFNVALPVGLIDDVARVVGLLLPDAPQEDLPLVYESGLQDPEPGDPFVTMEPRARWRRPLSWRRHGFALTEYGLFLRRGRVWRKLAVFPLARLQSVAVEQGPIDRAQNVAAVTPQTVLGPVTGGVVGIETKRMLELVDTVSRGAVAAAARDSSHRWAVAAPVGIDPAAVEAAPEPAEPTAAEPGRVPERFDEFSDGDGVSERGGPGDTERPE